MAERAKRMAQKFEQARDAAAPACHAAVPRCAASAVVCAMLRALAAGRLACVLAAFAAHRSGGWSVS
jgi:hypothetical protein